MGETQVGLVAIFRRERDLLLPRRLLPTARYRAPARRPLRYRQPRDRRWRRSPSSRRPARGFRCPRDSELRHVPGLAVLGGDLPLADLDGADIGIRDAAPRHQVQRTRGRGLSSRGDQPAQLVLLGGCSSREPRGIGLGVLQSRTRCCRARCGRSRLRKPDGEQLLERRHTGRAFGRRDRSLRRTRVARRHRASPRR